MTATLFPKIDLTTWDGVSTSDAFYILRGAAGGIPCPVEFKNDLRYVIVRQAWIHPNTGDLQFNTPPEFYRDCFVVPNGPEAWKTPVPTPPIQYWLDNSDPENLVWKDNAVNPAPEGTNLTDERLTPTQFWHAAIDETKLNEIDTDKLNKAKFIKKREIDRKYIQLVQSNFTWTDGHTYQCNEDARKNIGDALSVIDLDYTSWIWFDITNTQRTFTVADFKAMCKAMWVRGQGYYVSKQTKKAGVGALTTVSDVEAYDINNGW